MSIDIYSLIGWLGMIMLILAYFLLSIKKIKFNSIKYHLLNLFGAVGIAVSSFTAKAWASAALNIFWIAIAVFSVYKLLTIKPVYKELK